MIGRGLLPGLDDTSPPLRVWAEVVTGILNGDRLAIEERLAEDAVFYDAVLGTVRGDVTIARKLGGMRGRAFDSATAEVRQAFFDEVSCAVEWIQHLTTSSGPMTVEVASFCSVRDGRITRWCDYVQPIENRRP